MGKKSKSKPPKKVRSGFAGIRPNLQGDEIPRLKHMGDLGKKRWQELSNEMLEIQSTRSIILTTMLDGPV